MNDLALFRTPVVYLAGGGSVEHVPTWLGSERARAIQMHLEATVRWRVEAIGGHLVPRMTAWYGDPGAAYRYSGITNTPAPWTRQLLLLRERVHSRTGAYFNSALLNKYRDGNDSVSWHADDEPELGDEPIIASVSFGAPRRFILRDSAGESQEIEYTLGHGDLLVMRGPMQKRWRHSVPKQAGLTSARINVTFRLVRS